MPPHDRGVRASAPIPARRAAGRGEAADWSALFDGFAACAEWPGAALWEALLAADPGAKARHAERDEDAWRRNFSNTIQAPLAGPSPGGPPGWSDTVAELINERVLKGQGGEEAACRAAFRARNARIRDVAPADQLLVDPPGKGWSALCAFRGAPEPDAPYPHDNAAADFQAAMSNIKAGSEKQAPSRESLRASLRP